MRALVFGILAVAALAASAAGDDTAPPPGSKAAFDAYVADANAGYATDEFAVLKVIDAVYLKPGETVWLMEGGFRLSPNAPANLVPSIKFSDDGASAEVRDLGETHEAQTLSLAGSQTIDMGEGVKLRLQIAQIAPGVQGLRIAAYDQNAEAVQHFHGLLFYPFNPDLVLEARVEKLAAIEAFDFQTSRGWFKRFYRVAEAVFMHDGIAMRLPLYAGSDNEAEIDGFSSFFMDGTTGKTTYGAGRYMDWGFEAGAIPATILINFNEAYNPLCARSPHWNCPVAIDTLAFDVTAGEMKPEGGH